MKNDDRRMIFAKLFSIVNRQSSFVNYFFKFSIGVATPSPQQQQELKNPYFPLHRISSRMANMPMRDPEAPFG